MKITCETRGYTYRHKSIFLYAWDYFVHISSEVLNTLSDFSSSVAHVNDVTTHVSPTLHLILISCCIVSFLTDQNSLVDFCVKLINNGIYNHNFFY